MFDDWSATCWDARPVVELEVLVDLALALALGRLVDRELDLPLAVRHHLRHERGVLGRDVVVAEVDHLGHPEHLLVERDPVRPCGRARRSRRCGRSRAGRLPSSARSPTPRDVAREVRAFVAVAADERVHDVAVGRDRRELDLAEVVLDRPAARRRRARRAAPPARYASRASGTRSAMSFTPSPCCLAKSPISCPRRNALDDDEANVVLLEDVARAVAHARLGACVRRAAEAERVLVVVRGLLRVPDPELDVVPPVEGHEVFGHVDDSRAAPAGVPPRPPPRPRRRVTAAAAAPSPRAPRSPRRPRATQRRDEERRLDRVRRAPPRSAGGRRWTGPPRRRRDAAAAGRGSRSRPSP